MRHPSILAALLAVAALPVVPAVPADHTALVADIDRLAALALREGPVAGLSIVVARRGEVLLRRGYGLADIELDRPATADTVYHLDSITKNITAAAVLQLVEQGRLSLDDDVRRYLPNLTFSGRRVLVRQLLSHTSGVRSDAMLAPWMTPTSEQVDVELDFRPGSSWGYSNSGFQLLGMIISKVSGESYLDYVQRHLLAPLGMTSTSYCSRAANRAIGYRLEDGRFVRTVPVTMALSFAAGGFCSTAPDLARWQAALAQGKVLGPRALATMEAPTPLGGGLAVDYGLGTRIGELDGHPFVGHSGSGGGFSTAMAYFPHEDLAVVVLANTAARPGARVIAARVARRVLGLAATPARELPVPPGLAPRLTGLWFTSIGAAVLFQDRGKLWLRAVDSDGTGLQLRYLGGHTFRVAEDQLIRFVDGDRARPPLALTYDGGFFDSAFWRVTERAAQGIRPDAAEERQGGDAPSPGLRDPAER